MILWFIKLSIHFVKALGNSKEFQVSHKYKEICSIQFMLKVISKLYNDRIYEKSLNFEKLNVDKVNDDNNLVLKWPINQYLPYVPIRFNCLRIICMRGKRYKSYNCILFYLLLIFMFSLSKCWTSEFIYIYCMQM